MKIERTCRIELSADEVRKALTDFIIKREQYNYKSAIKSYEECLSWVAIPNLEGAYVAISVEWGTAHEPPEEAPIAPPPAANETPAANLEPASA